MGFSSLIRSQVLASSCNYTKGRKGYRVCKITPHQMAGVLSGENCAKIFQNPSRQASANYCIGNDGGIVGCVDENDRAWTSSSSSNDCQAITIEVSNSSTGGQWPVSDAAWNSLVELCVDICRRYNFRLNYDGTPNGSLTRHNMFKNTNCPGQYLQSRFQELANTVNAKLDGNSTSILCKAHIQDIGWTDYCDCKNGIGTENQGKRLEAIQFSTSDDINIQYRVHVQDIGWQDWKNKGEIAGTVGESKRIEAIEIKCNKILEVQEHIENVGWMPASKGTEIHIGTVGKALRLEAFKINIM